MPGHGYAFAMYQATVDELRELRRRAGRTPEQDRACLERLEDLYEQLTETEQQLVNGQGWRSWPDVYDRRERPRAPDA